MVRGRSGNAVYGGDDQGNNAIDVFLNGNRRRLKFYNVTYGDLNSIAVKVFFILSACENRQGIIAGSKVGEHNFFNGGGIGFAVYGIDIFIRIQHASDKADISSIFLDYVKGLRSVKFFQYQNVFNVQNTFNLALRIYGKFNCVFNQSNFGAVIGNYKIATVNAFRFSVKVEVTRKGGVSYQFAKDFCFFTI